MSILQIWYCTAKNGVSSLNVERLKENRTIMILDTGYWMLEKGVARAAQALLPRIVFLLFIKLTEYLVNPVSSIQYPASLSITGAAFLSK